MTLSRATIEYLLVLTGPVEVHLPVDAAGNIGGGHGAPGQTLPPGVYNVSARKGHVTLPVSPATVTILAGQALDIDFTISEVGGGIGANPIVPHPPPPPPPPPPPAPPRPCTYVNLLPNAAPGSIQRTAQWYNWSDLRPLQTTAQTGTRTGSPVGYTEAKVGSDGAWYCRIAVSSGPWVGGAWALRATDIGANPAQFCP